MHVTFVLSIRKLSQLKERTLKSKRSSFSDLHSCPLLRSLFNAIMMADAMDVDHGREDDYRESEDSDFDVGDVGDGDSSVSDDDEAPAAKSKPTAKRRKLEDGQALKEDQKDVELDSGDEATIREQKKARRQAKKSGEAVSDAEDEGWRAKTRAMREREKDERKRSKLASTKEATINVDQLWTEMNQPGNTFGKIAQPLDDAEKQREERASEAAKKIEEEMITIKRTYKFAGEIHTEEKKVPKSSAEARLWLSQQASRGKSEEQGETGEERPVRRPLRRISRFDPNFSNLENFKKIWAKATYTETELKGPKLNVVEKSKMDWAAHVDKSGLKDELDIAAKAKEGYLGRMDFLNEVDARREEDARKARVNR